MNLQTQPAPGNWSERRDNQFRKTKFHFHYMQISDYRYLENVLKNLLSNLNLAEDAPPIGIEALKTNILNWGLFMSTTMKAAKFERSRPYRGHWFGVSGKRVGSGWKRGRTWVCLKSRACVLVRSPKITSGWFRRSNSSMQRVFTPSCGPEFHTLHCHFENEQ